MTQYRWIIALLLAPSDDCAGLSQLNTISGIDSGGGIPLSPRDDRAGLTKLDGVRWAVSSSIPLSPRDFRGGFSQVNGIGLSGRVAFLFSPCHDGCWDTILDGVRLAPLSPCYHRLGLSQGETVFWCSEGDSAFLVFAPDDLGCWGSELDIVWVGGLVATLTPGDYCGRLAQVNGAYGIADAKGLCLVLFSA